MDASLFFPDFLGEARILAPGLGLTPVFSLWSRINKWLLLREHL